MLQQHQITEVMLIEEEKTIRERFNEASNLRDSELIKAVLMYYETTNAAEKFSKRLEADKDMACKILYDIEQGMHPVIYAQKNWKSNKIMIKQKIWSNWSCKKKCKNEKKWK